MSVAALLDEVAQRYDRAWRQLVPCYDDFSRTVLDLALYTREPSYGCYTWASVRGP